MGTNFSIYGYHAFPVNYERYLGYLLLSPPNQFLIILYWYNYIY
jgi:hypothetical protein